MVQRLPTITSSWHEAWSIFKGRFGTFVALAILPQVLTTGAVWLLSSLVMVNIKATGSLGQALSLTNAMVYVLVASITLLFVLQLFAAVAVILAATKRGHIGLIQAFDEARHFVWNFFLTSVLTTLLGGAAVVVGYVVVSLLTSVLVAVHYSDTATIFSALSILPFVLFLLVTTRYVLAGIVVVMEKASAWAALRRSAELIGGHYWAVVLRLLVVYTIILIVVLGASFVPYLGGLIAAALSIPFGVIYTFVLFEELTAAKK